MAGLAPGLARKAKKILETKTEDPVLLSALATLSTFYSENTASERRRLRSTIERRGLDISSELLHAADTVIESLEALQCDLDGLASSCQKITSALAVQKSSTAEFLAVAASLKGELQRSNEKSRLVTEFLNHYQLSVEEVAAIHEGDVNDSFFTTLSRISEIHGNCKELLRTHHQRAGLELMDTMSSYQETAFKRLCRWVQSQCRELATSDASEVEPLLKQAIMTLRDRPVLYRFCAEELAAALHNALFQRFIEALTRGSRPIEMHSDDPKRFINDMLAWVHQALASERELLENLFGDDNSGDLGGVGVSEAGEIPSSAHPVTRDEKMQNESVVSVEELLDSVFQSVCRPLKVRIEQVLIASPTVLLCFELSQLLAFYLETIGGLAGQRCQIVAVLRGCKEMASRTFQELLRARCDKLLRNAPVVPQDLSAPQQVMEIVVQLGEVAAAHGSSTTASPDESSLSDVVSSTVDLLVEVCEQTSEALSPDAPTRVDEAASMDPAVQRSFLVNCMDAIHGCLADHPAARGRAAGLANAIEGHLEALATAGVANVLARCGMAEIVSRVAEYDAAEPGSRKMASDPALGLSRVSSAMRAFFLDVSRPEALPEFREVLAPRLRTGAAGRVAAALAEAYEEVYSAVGRAENGYGPEGGVERIRHTPAQVRTILCVS